MFKRVYSLTKNIIKNTTATFLLLHIPLDIVAVVISSSPPPLPQVRLKLTCIARFLSYLSASLFALLSCLCHPAASKTSRRSSDRRARRETSSRRSSKEPQSSSISLWLIWGSRVRVLTTYTVPLLKTPPVHLQSSRQVYRCVFLRRWSESKVAAAGAGAELGGGAAGGGWQGGGWAEAAADPGPAGRVHEQPSRPGVGLLRASGPAGEQQARWASSSVSFFFFFFLITLTCPLKADFCSVPVMPFKANAAASHPATPACSVALLWVSAPWLCQG